MDEAVIRAPGLTTIIKFPFSSACTALEVPTSVRVAKGTTCPLLSLTCPETVLVCARAVMLQMNKATSNRTNLITWSFRVMDEFAIQRACAFVQMNYLTIRKTITLVAPHQKISTHL